MIVANYEERQKVNLNTCASHECRTRVAGGDPCDPYKVLNVWAGVSS